MRGLFLALLIGCGSGLQSTGADCKDGYERSDDGSCYEVDSDGDGDGDGDEGVPADGDAGDVDEGPPDDGPPPDEDGGDGEEFDDSCESPADCSDDKCPEESMGCTCLMEAGVCAPTCNTSADCPDLDDVEFECNADGICDLPIDD